MPKSESGQTIIAGKLHWYRKVTENGPETVEDGLGFPPPEIREELIRKDGEWLLFVGSEAKTLVGKILKEHLKLSLPEVAKILKTIPDKPVFIGTRKEADWVEELLVRAGVNSCFKVKGGYAE